MSNFYVYRWMMFVFLCFPYVSVYAEQAAALPSFGMSMQQVIDDYGQPIRKQTPVGNPPIAVWSYSNFNVYFEHQRVIHAIRFVSVDRPVRVFVE